DQPGSIRHRPCAPSCRRPPRGEAFEGHGGRRLSEKPNHLRDRRGSKTPSQPHAPHQREQNAHAGHRCLAERRDG
ncbi:hypothetical protein HN51_041144, partial [Arachis hypogaea]